MSAPACPQCGGTRVWRDGWRRLSDGSKVQRWVCRDCGFRFSASHKSDKRVTNDCRVCASTLEAKNSAGHVWLMKMKSDVEAGERAAGATSGDLKSLLFNFAWWMKKNGYAEATINSRVKVLRVLARRGADLRDPESVKDVIAQQENWSDVRREIAVHAYSLLARFLGIKWVPPRIRRVEKLPFIPLEEEIDTLISGCSQPISAFLLLLKETGMRAGEAYRLRWEDIDFQRQTVTVKPEKGSRARIFRVSDRLLNMLARLRGLDRKGGIFGYGSLSNLRRTFERQRKRIALKLGNPRINRITFHTLRHWKATMLYHQTKDILYVMNFLGHKSIKNTLVYVQIEESLFKKENEEFICKAARTVEEAKRLIEAGFEYVCEMEGVKLFRRRK